MRLNTCSKAFAGIGGGGLLPLVAILLSDIVPLRERGTWQGIISIIYALGSGCGAPLGMCSLPYNREILTRSRRFDSGPCQLAMVSG